LTEQHTQSHTPRIISRSEHNISRANISENALKVLYRLNKAGYQSHLVGGGVRDLLLGRQPKDFDIATDARPEQVRELFRNCRLIGRRFRLAHVHFKGEIIEVATFRGGFTDNEENGEDRHVKDGRILRDNIYGNQDEDAWRRDFTVNALFYDIKDFSVVDYVGGMEDLQSGVLRLIGDPEIRYREDPVRMLRAIRFATRLGFRIHPDTEQPMFKLGYLLEDIPPARLFEEILKLFQTGFAAQNYEMLKHYGLFDFLFPDTARALEDDAYGFSAELLYHGLTNTDSRIEQDKPVTPAFLFAVILWPAVKLLAREYSLRDPDLTEAQAMQLAAAKAITHQSSRISIPKRFSVPAREIWSMQFRLTLTRGKRPMRMLEHARFRAAYDFLLLRNEAGESLDELCQWWTRYQEMDPEQRRKLTQIKPRRRRKKKTNHD
jgi:poly(A) polymerase